MAYVNENIRILRNRMGLTQEKFAELIGINRKAIGAYEENRATPPLDKLNRMAMLFGISLDQLTQHRFAADTPLFEEPEEASSEESPGQRKDIPSGSEQVSTPYGRQSSAERRSSFPGFRGDESPLNRVTPSVSSSGTTPGFLPEEPPYSTDPASQRKGPLPDFRPEEVSINHEPSQRKVPFSGFQTEVSKVLPGAVTPVEKKRPFSRTGHPLPLSGAVEESAIRYVSHKYFDKYILDADFESRIGELPVFNFPFIEEGCFYRAFDVPADSYLQDGIIIGERLTDLRLAEGTGRMLVVSYKKGIFLRRLDSTATGEFVVKNEGEPDFILRPEDIREIWKPAGFFSRTLPAAQPDLTGLSAKFNALKAQFDALL